MKKKSLLFSAILLITLSGCSLKNNEDIKPPNIEETEIKQEEVISATSWDEIIPVIECSVSKDSAKMVPSIYGDSYLAYWSKEKDEESGAEIYFTSVSCFGIRESMVTSLYEKELENNGFLLSSSYNYGYKDISYTEELVVQYELVSEDNEYGMAHFDLLIYEVKMKEEEFPTNLIEETIGFNVPTLEGKSYEYYSTIGTNYEIQFALYAYFCEENALSNYVTLLQSSNYTVSLTDGIYFASRNDKLVDLLFYQYDESTIYLRISSSWPYLYIIDYLGFDLPKLDSGYTSLSFSFVAITENTEALCIYYDGTKEESLSLYSNKLIELGFKLKDNDIQKNEYTITTNTFVINENLEDQHIIKLMYCVEQESLCIAIIE